MGAYMCVLPLPVSIYYTSQKLEPNIKSLAYSYDDVPLQALLHHFGLVRAQPERIFPICFGHLLPELGHNARRRR